MYTTNKISFSNKSLSNPQNVPESQNSNIVPDVGISCLKNEQSNYQDAPLHKIYKHLFSIGILNKYKSIYETDKNENKEKKENIQKLLAEIETEQNVRKKLALRKEIITQKKKLTLLTIPIQMQSINKEIIKIHTKISDLQTKNKSLWQKILFFLGLALPKKKIATYWEKLSFLLTMKTFLTYDYHAIMMEYCRTSDDQIEKDKTNMIYNDEKNLTLQIENLYTKKNTYNTSVYSTFWMKKKYQKNMFQLMCCSPTFFNSASPRQKKILLKHLIHELKEKNTHTIKKYPTLQGMNNISFLILQKRILLGIQEKNNTCNTKDPLLIRCKQYLGSQYDQNTINKIFSVVNCTLDQYKDIIPDGITKELMFLSEMCICRVEN